MIGNALRNLARGDRFGRRARASLAGAVLVVVPSVLGANASARRPHDAPPVAKTARHHAGPIAAPEPAGGPESAGVEQAGLRSIRSVGVATRPLIVAADALLRSLPLAQQAQAGVPVDAIADLDPLGPDSRSRPGLRLDDLAEPGREALVALVEASLAAPGLADADAVARLRRVLAEPAAVDHFTLLGNLGADEAWGWQLDGPRLTVCYLVAGDIVVVTPTAVDAPSALVAVGPVSPSAP